MIVANTMQTLAYYIEQSHITEAMALELVGGQSNWPVLRDGGRDTIDLDAMESPRWTWLYCSLDTIELDSESECEPEAEANLEPEGAVQERENEFDFRGSYRIVVAYGRFKLFKRMYESDRATSSEFDF